MRFSSVSRSEFSRFWIAVADNYVVATLHQGKHCPFLNRADERCSSSFSLDGLDHAYAYCFDKYKTCPVYLQLLTERRVRRISGMVTQTSVQNHVANKLVQIAVAHRNASADAQAVSVASGV